MQSLFFEKEDQWRTMHERMYINILLLRTLVCYDIARMIVKMTILPPFHLGSFVGGCKSKTFCFEHAQFDCWLNGGTNCRVLGKEIRWKLVARAKTHGTITYRWIDSTEQFYLLQPCRICMRPMLKLNGYNNSYSLCAFHGLVACTPENFLPVFYNE